ncbi:MAG: AAA family ATPase [Geobacteraceae bacterium]|nr:AAA family ATPase [Geobacteraceae bacterium]
MIKVRKRIGNDGGGGEDQRPETVDPVSVPVEAGAAPPHAHIVLPDPSPAADPVPAADGSEKKRRFDFFPKLSKRPVSVPDGEPSPQPSLEHQDVKPRSGWVSPTYSVSRKVTLDPAALRANRCILHRPQDSVEVDAYRVLRTKILHACKERGGNTIMVTSAVSGEGKTLTAVNIAVTLAKEFQQTVLLVDCDLRRQSVHRYLGYESNTGLIDYLLNDTPVPELMTWPGIEKLTVISGGRSISGGSELLGSTRMKELVEDMKTRYPERYIIFDAPPLLAGADALAFVPLVDHVVVVVREGATSADDVNRAMKLVPPGKVLGLVLNGQKELSHMVAYSLNRGYSA